MKGVTKMKQSMKKFKNGFANVSTMVFLVILAVFGLIAFFSYSSTYNMAVASEESIQNLQRKSESVLSNYTIGIQEMAQVPAQYKKHLEEIVKASMEGRYGENGSKAVQQFLVEQNIPFNDKLYLNLQNSMAAGRREFQNSQQRLMDACRNYKLEINSFMTGKLLAIQGFPKINLENYCEVVSDAQTKKAFETKQQQPVKIE